MNLYEKSWQLYKEHSESFVDDIPYYVELTRGCTTLELFAGYGRISNALAAQGVDLEVIELSAEFASLIDIPQAKKHIGDVSKLRVNKKFQRIIAAYNSFCLLTSPDDLRAFFQNIAAMLAPGGIASLSYYHPDVWADAKGHDFTFRGQKVAYVPSCDLTQRHLKRGVWIDTYRFADQEVTFEYPVRIFESFADLAPFIEGTGLALEGLVLNYNNPEIEDRGWQEYVFKKA